jgi:DNA polymerase I-like protein with 3'-5' exonuclease and polymerase domains
MSRIRQCFPSRYKDGLLIEADYSQLEIVVLAYLSNDENLIKDLISGRDLHRMRASQLYTTPEHQITPEQRRIAKTLSFQLQYGAGAKTMAEVNKIPKALAQEFIDNFYARYSEVEYWQEKLQDYVKSNKGSEWFDYDSHALEKLNRTPLGIPRHPSAISSPTKRTLVFREYDSKYGHKTNYKKRNIEYSPTEIKNYPVQSLATDIMKIALGAFAYKIWFTDSIKIINTVHDNIVIDCKLEERENVCNMLQWAMVHRTTKILQSRYDIELPVPLSIEIKSGKVWSDMSTVDI